MSKLSRGCLAFVLAYWLILPENRGETCVLYQRVIGNDQSQRFCQIRWLVSVGCRTYPVMETTHQKETVDASRTGKEVKNAETDTFTEPVVVLARNVQCPAYERSAAMEAVSQKLWLPGISTCWQPEQEHRQSRCGSKKSMRARREEEAAQPQGRCSSAVCSPYAGRPDLPTFWCTGRSHSIRPVQTHCIQSPEESVRPSVSEHRAGFSPDVTGVLLHSSDAQ
jgi:hypothetical protein